MCCYLDQNKCVQLHVIRVQFKHAIFSRNLMLIYSVDFLSLQRNLNHKKNERNLIFKAYFMIADGQHNTFALYLVNYNWWIHHKGYEQYERDNRQTFRDVCTFSLKKPNYVSNLFQTTYVLLRSTVSVCQRSFCT